MDSKSAIQLLIILGIGSFLVLYFMCGYSSTSNYSLIRVKVPENDANLPQPKLPSGFLVHGNYCRIRDIDPFAENVMKLFQKQKYEPCETNLPLTTIEQNFETDSVRIIFHANLLSTYLTFGQTFAECHYQEISRSGFGKYSDMEYTLSLPQHFDAFFELPVAAEFILIECTANTFFIPTKVYSNAHPVIRHRKIIQESLDAFKSIKTKERSLSVLMVGIDSISRLNLLRAMPETAQHLYDSGWFDLQGYSKIGDNTFPNLMALLTGYNDSLTDKICNAKKGHLNNCTFIWDQYKDSGYVTAYAEDEQSMSSFVYSKLGFMKQPTDYYLRPWGLAAENKLKIQYKSYLKYCLGFYHYAEYIYQYAIDFATVYKNDPYFGLFWINTFSHNILSDPSAFDSRTKEFLKDLEKKSILENHMVVFLSDHGMRFGKVRELHTGWLEERMPFIFIWLPEWFKKAHPEIVLNLKLNRNRLINPYDIHMTLKHILELSGRADNLPIAESCPNCKSIFKEIPLNRSCEQIAINPHWCTCTRFEALDSNSQAVHEIAEEIVAHINNGLEEHSGLCATLRLKNVVSAKKSVGNQDFEAFLVTVKVMPSRGIFEATVKRNEDNVIEVLGTISRLNMYGNQSECISTKELKLFCYCLNN